MNVKLSAGPRYGTVQIPASKSQCHRLFICAALGNKNVSISCGEISKDIEATISCLNALGAEIKETSKGVYSVKPVAVPSKHAELFCGESGSTLRFMLPVAGLLGCETVFHLDGRLSKRPLDALIQQLAANGMSVEQNDCKIYCRGNLSPGNFTLPGNESSQYISALLMVLPLLDGSSSLKITGQLQSEPYVKMTEDVLRLSGTATTKNGCKYEISGGCRYNLPQNITAEGDYSSAAFFLCAGALSKRGISVNGLNPASSQGDREILDILRRIGADVSVSESMVTVRKNVIKAADIDAGQIPDLIPAVSALLCFADGESRIYNAERLRLKESDRLKTTSAILKSLGADIEELHDGLYIKGKNTLTGGMCESFNDHRIAMAAAVAACGCTNYVEIENAQAVQKSYPDFWRDFNCLKGEN